MKKIRKHIDLFNNRAIICFFIFVVYIPPYFATFHIFNQINLFATLGVFLILLIFLMKLKKKDKHLIWIFSYWGWLFFVTLLNNPDNISLYIRNNISSICMCLIFYMWMDNNSKILIDGLAIFDLYVIVNFLTIVFFPDGLYSTDVYTDNWLLGYKNQQIRMILPIISFTFIRSYFKFGKLTLHSKILLFISIMTFLLIDSATSLAGIIIFLLALLLFHSKEKKLPKFFSLFVCAIVVIILFIIIVIVQNIEMFSFIIEGFFKRSMTLTSRTIIWNYALEVFAENKLFGYGYLSAADYSEFFGGIPAYAHPHNYILYNAMMGGVILIIILMVGLYFANEALKKASDSIYGKIILFCLCSFLIMGITESITGTILLYPMFIMAMKVNAIQKYSTNNEISAL